MTITTSPEHGYVILAASGAFLLNLWQMMKIGGKRKELGITVRAIYTSGIGHISYPWTIFVLDS